MARSEDVKPKLVKTEAQVRCSHCGMPLPEGYYAIKIGRKYFCKEDHALTVKQIEEDEFL